MSMSQDRDNPFAPPKAAVLQAASADDGLFVEEGQRVAAGRGGTWWAQAWELFKKAPGTWILIFIVFMAVSIVFAIIPLGSLVTNICYPVIAAGVMLGCRSLEEGNGLAVGHLFAAFKKNVGSLLLVGVLYLVGMMMIGLFVGIGMALMIPKFAAMGQSGTPDFMALAPIFLIVVLVALALMLPLIMAIWFAPAIVVFHDVQPMAAMKASFAGSLRNFVPFLVYGVVGLGLAIVAAIPLGLGFLVYGPMLWATVYTGYRDIYIKHD
jgi:hypothetical protein